MAEAGEPGVGTRTAGTVVDRPMPARPHVQAVVRRLLAGVFVVVVLGHWAEHVLQAAQIWWFGWQAADAGGALGLAAPELAHSEVLHVVYNVAILLGLAGLLSAFTGRARRWWTAALVSQTWHAFEHLLLWWQAATGARPLGTAAPSSIVQLVVPRVELHLAYNTVVTALIVTALFAAGFVRLPKPEGSRHRGVRRAAPLLAAPPSPVPPGTRNSPPPAGSRSVTTSATTVRVGHAGVAGANTPEDAAAIAILWLDERGTEVARAYVPLPGWPGLEPRNRTSPS